MSAPPDGSIQKYFENPKSKNPHNFLPPPPKPCELFLVVLDTLKELPVKFKLVTNFFQQKTSHARTSMLSPKCETYWLLPVTTTTPSRSGYASKKWKNFQSNILGFMIVFVVGDIPLDEQKKLVWNMVRFGHRANAYAFC